jgi:hypothetical protein
MIVVCPGGAEDGVENEIDDSLGTVHICRSSNEAVLLYQHWS